MDSSSVCVRILGLKWWRKTQEITFDKLLINLLLNGSIWLLKKWRKPLKRVGKTGAKIHLKSFLKTVQQSPLI